MLDSERTGQDWKDEAIALRTVLKPLADQRDDALEEVERLKAQAVETEADLETATQDAMAQHDIGEEYKAEVERLKDRCGDLVDERNVFEAQSQTLWDEQESDMKNINRLQAERDEYKRKLEASESRNDRGLVERDRLKKALAISDMKK